MIEYLDIVDVINDSMIWYKSHKVSGASNAMIAMVQHFNRLARHQYRTQMIDGGRHTATIFQT